MKEENTELSYKELELAGGLINFPQGTALSQIDEICRYTSARFSQEIKIRVY